MDEEIERVMREMNWDALHEVYAQNQWQWGPFNNRPAHIPSADELKETARGLLRDVTERGISFTSTGRLTAHKKNGKLSIHVEMPKRSRGAA